MTGRRRRGRDYQTIARAIGAAMFAGRTFPRAVLTAAARCLAGQTFDRTALDHAVDSLLDTQKVA